MDTFECFCNTHTFAAKSNVYSKLEWGFILPRLVTIPPPLWLSQTMLYIIIIIITIRVVVTPPPLTVTSLQKSSQSTFQLWVGKFSINFTIISHLIYHFPRVSWLSHAFTQKPIHGSSYPTTAGFPVSSLSSLSTTWKILS